MDDPNPTDDSVRAAKHRCSALLGRSIKIVNPGPAHALYRDSACRVPLQLCSLVQTGPIFQWKVIFGLQRERRREGPDPIHVETSTVHGTSEQLLAVEKEGGRFVYIGCFGWRRGHGGVALVSWKAGEADLSQTPALSLPETRP